MTEVEKMRSSQLADMAAPELQVHGAGHLTHGHDLIFQRFIGKQFFFSLFCQRA